MKDQAQRLCLAGMLGAGMLGLTACGGGGDASEPTAAATGSPAMREQAQAAAPVYAAISTLKGTALPGLVSMVYSGPETVGSDGIAKTVPATVMTPGISVNGLGGTVVHRAGFLIKNATSPINGVALNAPMTYPVATKSKHTFAGVSVTRHYSFDPVIDQNLGVTSSRWIVSHDLSSIGAKYSSFTLWSYHGARLSGGYFSGRPVIWGGFAWGSATLGTDLPASGSKQYGGLAGMYWLTPNWNYFDAPYGTAKAVFDAAKRTVTVTVQPKEFGALSARLHPLQEENGAFWADAPGWLTAAVQCKASVNRADGSFSCSDPAQGVEVAGRFYGPGATEIAGTFRRSLNGYYPLIGGFTAKLK
ncbi:transferrin-binding protein-like solute binding protein [Azohydromonas lata]|uniref:Transferrin-binding protein B C-lobe/N-lobe beta-barrel domain-containing protein n=1 Tax=Azohydromonas lata TaxID=45677 RepID=A0ABU5ILM6_9BURK|nr:hypothetical protein [Azohydromonas lata]MDZ5459788.1 hypothetical protein [Azohydromonas lata]